MGGVVDHNAFKTEYQTLDNEDPPLDYKSQASKKSAPKRPEKKGLFDEPKMARNTKNY